MRQLTCVNKVRDPQGRIVSYIMEDMLCNRHSIEAVQLKNMIFIGEVEVDNLKLTSDGRLIDSTVKNNQTDIIGTDNKAGARQFVDTLVKRLNSMGVKAQSRQIDTKGHSSMGTCVILSFNNGKLISTKGKELNTRLEDKLAGTGMTECGIAVKLLVKTSRADGNNKMLDYQITFGVVKSAIHGNGNYRTEYLATGDILSEDITQYLNHEMDAYEMVLYAAKYKQDNQKQQASLTDMLTSIDNAALYFAQQLIDLFGVPSKQLSMSTRVGHALANIPSESAMYSLGDKLYEHMQNSGYNTDMYEEHKKMIKDNTDSVNSAAGRLGVQTIQQRGTQLQADFNERAQKKGLFGAFKR